MSPDTGPDVGILVRLDMARPLYFTPLSVIRNNTSINDYELTGEFFRLVEYTTQGVDQARTTDNSRWWNQLTNKKQELSYPKQVARQLHT